MKLNPETLESLKRIAKRFGYEFLSRSLHVVEEELKAAIELGEMKDDLALKLVAWVKDRVDLVPHKSEPKPFNTKCPLCGQERKP